MDHEYINLRYTFTESLHSMSVSTHIISNIIINLYYLILDIISLY